MSTIRFGRTEAQVPAIGFGTWGHGGAKTVKGRPVGWSGHDAEAARAALVAGYRAGLTHWDTADVYGDGGSEELIGGLWNEIPREEIFLATKVGWGYGGDRHPYHPDRIRRSAERSLVNLATDRIDLYYLHHCEFGRDDAYLDGAVETLRRLREEGKIRFVGLSDWSSAKVARYAPVVDPDVVQPYRNVVDDGYADSDLPAWVEANDAGVAFFSPLKHGLLLGRYEEPPELEPGDHRAANPAFSDSRLIAHYRRCRQAVEQRFADHPQPVLHALTAALLADTPTGCALLGLRRPGHVADAATLGEPLSAEDATWVRELYRAEPSGD